MGASRLLSSCSGICRSMWRSRSGARLVCSSPPSPRRHRGSRGARSPALVDGCPEGRADISLRSTPAPKRRSWSRTRKSWSRVARGRELPPARWVQGEPKSPWSRCNGDYVASAGTGSMPVSVKRPAEQSLGETLPKERMSPRDWPWGVRGGWEIPPQGVARYYRAHLVRF